MHRPQEPKGASGPGQPPRVERRRGALPEWGGEAHSASLIPDAQSFVAERVVGDGDICRTRITTTTLITNRP
jgi:hypothetical protein